MDIFIMSLSIFPQHFLLNKNKKKLLEQQQ